MPWSSLAHSDLFFHFSNCTSTAPKSSPSPCLSHRSLSLLFLSYSCLALQQTAPRFSRRPSLAGRKVGISSEPKCQNTAHTNIVSYNQQEFGTCTTLSASQGSQPTPLPTSYSRGNYQSTTEEPTVTIQSSVYVTLNSTTGVVATSYTQVYATVTTTLPVTTVTTTLGGTSVIGTATSTSVVCTNGISAPASTVTEYTGSYTPISGQPTGPASSFPTLVTCTELTTTVTTLEPTLISGTTILTYTPSTTTSVVAITQTQTFISSMYSTTSTVTANEIEYLATSTIVTLSTSCPATTTTTYAAKCAPTNLIGSIDGEGIEEAGFPSGATLVAPGHGAADGDASLCCQLCQDSEGCAAMLYFAQSSSCDLVFTNSTCGVAYSYEATTNWVANEGNILQTGCGTITQVTSS